MASQSGSREANDGGPSWSKAWRHHLLNSPSYIPDGGSEAERREFEPCVPTGRFCEMCDIFREGYHSSFDIFGSGVTSFFKFEKWLTWMWSILTILALPAIIINTFGPGNEESAPVSGLAGTTLRNMYSTKFNDTVPLFDGTEVPTTYAAVVYAGCDFVGAALFLVGYFYMRFMLIEEEHIVDRSIVTASDYSMYLPVVPPDTTEAQLEEWVERVAVRIRAMKLKEAKNNQQELSFKPGAFLVVDINIVENNSGILGLMLKRAELLLLLRRVESRIRVGQQGKIKFTDECVGCFASAELRGERKALHLKVKRVVDRIVAIKVSRGRTAHASADAVAAFITLDSAQDLVDFVAEFHDSSTSLFCQKKAYFFRDKAVQVLPAPEPSAVLWTNLHVGALDSFARQRGSDFLSVWVILFSFIIIFFASWQSEKYNGVFDLQQCAERDVAAFTARYRTYHSVEEEYTWQNTTSDMTGKLFCLCEQQKWESLTTVEMVEQFPWRKACITQYCNRLFIISPDYAYGEAQACKAWSGVKTSAIIFSVAASILVVIINQSLGTVLRYLADWEGHHSVEYRDVSVAVRLFFAQFFNTAVLMIIVNIAWPDISYEGQKYKIGQYADLSSGWYDNVGSQLMTTMIINCVSPHVYYVVSALFLRWRMSNKQLNPIMTEDDANEGMVGSPIDMALRHAQLINVAFVTYVFSTGLPLLIPIGAISFFLNYWVDKILFVKYYARPAMATNAITVAMSGLLPIALLGHLAFGVWMLGSVGTFNKALKEYSPLNYEAYLEPSIGNPSADKILASQTGLGGVLLNTIVTNFETNITAGYRFYVEGYGGFNDTISLNEYFFNITKAPELISVPAYDRIFAPSGLPLFVLFVLTLVLFTIMFILRLLGNAATSVINIITCGVCKKAVSNACVTHVRSNETPSFTAVVSARVKGSKMAIQGTPTYNILGQPQLQRQLHVNPRLAALSNSLVDAAFTDEAEVTNIMYHVQEPAVSGEIGDFVDGQTDADQPYNDEIDAEVVPGGAGEDAAPTAVNVNVAGNDLTRIISRSAEQVS